MISLKDFERKVLIGAWGEGSGGGYGSMPSYPSTSFKSLYRNSRPKILLTIVFQYIYFRVSWKEDGSCFTETEINEKM